MKRSLFSPRASWSQKHFQKILLIGALVTLAIVALFGTRLRNDAKTRDGAEQRANAYRNRALSPSRTSSGPAAQQAKPTIEGHVYAGDGSTIAGATVVANTFELAGNILSKVGSVQSDELGRFALNVPPGTYQLNASMAGYGPATITAHTGETASLVLPKSGVILGHVHDAEGRPIQRFVIDVVGAVPIDMPAPPPVLSQRFESAENKIKQTKIKKRRKDK